ncbi:hypothetical protein EVAR_44459_1 [Eumeta japonica]|uniref:Uncharacterized protein n=1 Tax=Eumeta variegata TaxID=151549 RepID=A0A4C1WMY5_EUMVA|nr:hypothetical protein EVAR_44459_1 [Eumeta japonica]
MQRSYHVEIDSFCLSFWEIDVQNGEVAGAAVSPIISDGPSLDLSVLLKEIRKQARRQEDLCNLLEIEAVRHEYHPERIQKITLREKQEKGFPPAVLSMRGSPPY